MRAYQSLSWLELKSISFFRLVAGKLKGGCLFRHSCIRLTQRFFNFRNDAMVVVVVVFTVAWCQYFDLVQCGSVKRCSINPTKIERSWAALVARLVSNKMNSTVSEGVN
jgi:hypothetical protein